MGADFGHYANYDKPQGPQPVELQRLFFDSILTDDELKTLIQPFEPHAIIRRKYESCIEFFAKYDAIKPLVAKLKKAANERYAELAPIWEAEREAKFQEYYRSLNLDDKIQIPCINTYPDGRSEAGVYTMKIHGL